MFEIKKLTLTALCACCLCAGAVNVPSEVAAGDAADFAAIQSVLPAGKTVYRIWNLRNFKYYGMLTLEKLAANLSDEVGISMTDDFREDSEKFFELAGVDDFKTFGVADARISEENNVWEVTSVAYSGRPVDGLFYEMFKGEFDTVKAAGSWPVSTIWAFRGNLRVTPAAKLIHENIEPLPQMAAEVCKALSGRYSAVLAEDEEGLLLDIVVPDNDAGFLFYSLKALVAQEPGVLADNEKIVMRIDDEQVSFEIIVFRRKNMIRICNGRNVPARLKALPKLRDDKDFADLTAGLEPMGETVVYTGGKIVNPLFEQQASAAEKIDFSNIFIDAPWDSRIFMKSSFTHYGVESKCRMYGNTMQNSIENIKFILESAGMMIEEGYYENF